MIASIGIDNSVLVDHAEEFKSADCREVVAISQSKRKRPV
jgi:hypothetical protein